MEALDAVVMRCLKKDPDERYGSIAELERDFGVALTDLHRPAVDGFCRKQPQRKAVVADRLEFGIS